MVQLVLFQFRTVKKLSTMEDKWMRMVHPFVIPYIKKNNKKNKWKWQKKTASLQQSIVSSFQRMSKEERDLELEKAKKVHTHFLSTAMKLPPGPERVNYLQSVDQPTQRLLILHKLCA